MKRIDGLDFLRGIAVVGMIFYHAVYVVDFYGLAEVDFGEVRFVILARVVQFLFLGLVGVGMAMSCKRAGFIRRQLKRVLVIGAMAGLVSFCTWAVLGDLFVRFGILHLIAVSSFCLMWLVRWRLAVLAVGVLGLFLPFSFLAYPSVDYFPLFPWISVVAAGVLLSGFVVGVASRFNGVRWVNFLGRNSLWVYMVHVPLIWAVVLLMRV
ncbi:DUF1624 domain-containing protein [Candidatus Gracilibacteria bacterium]|nr:DUF1624 domain-containing protein [Candidatus Gracilibacteria bacterium]